MRELDTRWMDPYPENVLSILRERFPVYHISTDKSRLNPKSLEKALEVAVSPADRLMFHARYLEHLSYPQISEKYHTTPGVAFGAVDRTFLRLRRYYQYILDVEIQSNGKKHSIYILGLKDNLNRALTNAGYTTIESLQKKTVQQLVKINGIGMPTAISLRETLDKWASTHK